MAKKIRSAADIFYYVEDVQRLLGCSKSKAYKVIAAMNKEMQDKGYCICLGKVNQEYFNMRYGIQ